MLEQIVSIVYWAQHFNWSMLGAESAIAAVKNAR